MEKPAVAGFFAPMDPISDLTHGNKKTWPLMAVNVQAPDGISMAAALSDFARSEGFVVQIQPHCFRL